MNSKTRRVVLAAVALIAIAGAYLPANPRFGALFLVASWDTISGGIGIPDLTKTYEASLTNYGLLPVRVHVCDFVIDAGGRGKSNAYSVERWDPGAGKWEFFWGEPREYFCEPYPPGITADSKIRSAWLWPGQSIPTGFVAIQAVDGLKLGDTLRFAIKPFLNREDIAIASSPFAIDELPAISDVDFRIRH